MSCTKLISLFGLLGLLLFMLGIYISQWTVFGIVIGIAGGFVMGLSSLRSSRG